MCSRRVVRGAAEQWQNPYTAFVDEAEGLTKLEQLQTHNNEDVYKKAVHILESYFGLDDDDDTRLARDHAAGLRLPGRCAAWSTPRRLHLWLRRRRGETPGRAARRPVRRARPASSGGVMGAAPRGASPCYLCAQHAARGARPSGTRKVDGGQRGAAKQRELRR